METTIKNKIIVQRLVAEVLDLIFCYLLGLIPMSLVIFTFTYLQNNKMNTDSGTIFVYISMILILVLYFAYNMIPLVIGKGTLGYKIMKLKVVLIDGSRISKSKAFLRTLLKLLLMFLMPTYIIPFLFGYFLVKSGGEENLLDKIVKTHAVQA